MLRSPFVRSVVSVASGNYLMIALSFLIGVIVARNLGPEGFGRLTVMLVAVQVASALVFAWTLTALVRFGAQEFARTGSVAETFWARMTLIAPLALGVAAALAVGREAVADYLEIPRWGLWLVFAYFLLSQLLTSVGHVFQACGRMGRYAMVISLDRVVVLIAVLALPTDLAADVVGVVACYAAGSLLVLGWSLARAGRLVLRPPWPSGTAVAAVWAFSSPLFLSSAVSIVGGQAVLLAVVKHFTPARDLGLYSLASQIAGALQQLAVIVAVVLLPRLSVMVSRGQDDEMRMLVQRIVPYALLGISVVLGACVVVATPAITLLFGPAFVEAAGVLMILILGSMALAFFSLLAPFFSAYGLTWTLTAISAATAAVNVAAALLFVPRYGTFGAAAAFVCASLTAAALTVIAIGRRLRAGGLRLVLIATPATAAAAVGLLTDGGYAYVGSAAALIAGTYAVVAGLRLFGADDVAALRRVGLTLPVGHGLSTLFRRDG